MKKLMLGAVALTMLATACKKKDDNGTPANSFKIGSTTYSVVASGVTKMGSLVSAGGTNGTTGGSIIFSFNGSTTPAAGDYTVISADSTEGAGQMSFIAANGTGGTGTAYGSTGAGTVKAKVTINGGKISISMPDAPAKAATGTETVTVNANISE